MTDRAAPPIPNGWYAVAWSKEIKPGEVKRVYAFEKELVVFRTESGKATIFDAYCPHLGAHLGEGGTVVGENLRCPFHHWQFDTEGSCVGIPYAKRIPPKARVGTWPVVECAGMVFAWNHALGKPPFFDVPKVPEYDHPDWSEPHSWEIEVETHVQDMAENNCDPPHFLFVHDSEEVPESEIEYLDGGVTMRMASSSERETVIGTYTSELERYTWCIGLAGVRVKGVGDAGLLMFSSTTPITRTRSHSRWVFMVTRNLEGSAGQEFIDSMKEGVQQDMEIWNHKMHRADPLLCEGDRFLAEYRRWTRQFYSEPVGPERVEAPASATGEAAPA